MPSSSADPTATVVLVHGAWHGAWCFERVLPLVRAAGVDVRAVDLARDGFASDVDSVRVVLDAVDGDVVLLGHSYGGAVVTEAGVHPSVRHLVYLCAFALDEGEACTSAARDDPDAASISHQGRPNLGHAMVPHDDDTTTLTRDGARACLYQDVDDETFDWAFARLGRAAQRLARRGADRARLAHEAVDLRRVHRGPGRAPRPATDHGPSVHRGRRMAARALPVRQPSRPRGRPARRPRPTVGLTAPVRRSGSLLPYCIVAGSMSLGYGSIYTLLADLRDRYGFTEAQLGRDRGGRFPRRVRRAALARPSRRPRVRADARPRRHRAGDGVR